VRHDRGAHERSQIRGQLGDEAGDRRMIDTSGLPMPEDAPEPRRCIRVERPETGLVVLVFDPPHRSLPVLDLPLLRDLDLALEEIEADSGVRGLVITGRNATSFAAGADIDALASLTAAALVGRVVDIGHGIFSRIAQLSRTRLGFVSVAAIGGAAPGGACEISLACDYIVASDAQTTRIGLPETQLGILPAWGGCNRLPRKIGVPAALEAILSGKLYSAKEALKIGLVDRLAKPEDLVRIAGQIALGKMRCSHEPRGMSGKLVDKTPFAANYVASQAKKQVIARTNGRYPAPLAALEIVARAPRTPLAQGFAAERNAASELAVGRIAKNLIGIFKLSEEAKKLKQLPDGSSARKIARGGVLGAGVMGRGIASLMAERGVWTRLFDIAPEALDVALLEHRAEIEKKQKRRRLEPREANEAVDKLDATREPIERGGFARAEIVIEAVAEKLEIKRDVFGKLAAQMADDAILASNTSSLSIAAIAEGIPHPERVVGLHFFNPVKRMPLVEIVRGPRTSDRVVAECAGLALALGKTPVVVKDVAGFLVNRLLGPYLDESLRLWAGGIAPGRLDRALTDFGMPMGPLALLDEVGFDIAAHAAVALHAAYGARMTPCDVLEGMIREKRLGKKSGRGFYVHAADSAGGKKEKPVLALDLAHFIPAGAPRAPEMSDQDIVDRVLLAMLDEAARAIEEEVVAGPRELDLATVFGMGFPPFHGGLLRWADARGATEITAKLEAIARSPDVAARSGGRERFEPAERLLYLARNMRGFHG
jgi:3-hydroxyacyl-CoA dehydrogenase/enoyl-CoA hydratase/3-hydroxybutyryl-CoA epimerase